MTIPSRNKRKFLRDAPKEKDPKKSRQSKCDPPYPRCNASTWLMSFPCQSRATPDSKVCCNASMAYSNDNTELQPDLLPLSSCDLAGIQNRPFHSDHPTNLTHHLQLSDNYYHCNFVGVPDVFGELVVVSEPVPSTELVKSFQVHDNANYSLKPSFAETPEAFGDLVIVPECNVNSSDLVQPEKTCSNANQHLGSAFTETIDAFGECVIVPEGAKHGRGSRDAFHGISPLKRVASEDTAMVTEDSSPAAIATDSSFILIPTTGKISESPPTENTNKPPLASASKHSRDPMVRDEALVRPTFDTHGRVIIYFTDSEDDTDEEEEEA